MNKKFYIRIYLEQTATNVNKYNEDVVDRRGRWLYVRITEYGRVFRKPAVKEYFYDQHGQKLDVLVKEVGYQKGSIGRFKHELIQNINQKKYFR